MGLFLNTGRLGMLLNCCGTGLAISRPYRVGTFGDNELCCQLLPAKAQLPCQQGRLYPEPGPIATAPNHRSWTHWLVALFTGTRQLCFRTWKQHLPVVPTHPRHRPAVQRLVVSVALLCAGYRWSSACREKPAGRFILAEGQVIRSGMRRWK